MSDISPWQAQSARPEENYSQYIAGSANQELHLRDFWNIIVKRYRLVSLVFGVVAGIGVYINFSATRMYTATSSLRIEPQNPTVVGVGQVLPAESGSGGTYDYYQTQFVLLGSREVAAKVINELSLESNPFFARSRIVSANPINRLQSWVLSPFKFLSQVLHSNEQSPNPAKESSAKPETDIDPALIDRYLSFLSVNPVQKTRLVEVSMTTPDARLSRQLANAHVTTFINMNLDVQFSITNEAREFLDRKNAELKDKLEKSEAELNRFRQQHGVVSLDKGENVVVDRLMELNRQLTLARADRIQAEALYRTVQNKNPQNLVEVINNSLITTIKGTLANLESERARLSTTYKAEHPRLAEISQQIAEVRRSLNQEITNITRGIESSYNASRAKEDAFQKEASKQQAIALDLKEVGVQYAVLQEEVNVNRTLYESVLKRLSETHVSNDIPVTNMRVAQTADMPRFPSVPKTERALAFVVALGIFLGVGLAFGLEYLDSSVGTPAMVWRVAAKPTLGVVPKLISLGPPETRGRRFIEGLFRSLPISRWLPSNNSNRPAPVVAQHPASIVADSFRTIRTALLLSRAEKPPQVILLTSPSPGEGKTVTTLNLAIALAQGGKSVLVIDADLRRGRCHELVGLVNNGGLTEVLTSSVPWQERIQQSKVDGLSLLSRGAVPPYAPDLLASSKMGEVLNSMRQAFEFILIDSPPVLPVTDAIVLSGYGDGTVLVVHAQNTTVDSTRQAMDRLQVVRSSVLGVVLNSIDTRNPDYAYYYSYYRSYEPDEPAAPYREEKTAEPSPKDNIPEIDVILSKVTSVENQPQNAKVTIIDQPAENGVSKPEPTPHEAVTMAHRTHHGGAPAMERSPEEQPSETQPVRHETSAVVNKPNVDKPNKGGSRAKERSSTEHLLKLQLVTQRQKSEVVPQNVFDHMVVMLREAAGPMAPIIVHDHIQSLGESQEAFPAHRFKELFNRVSEEILDVRLRTDFRRTMQGDFRNLL